MTVFKIIIYSVSFFVLFSLFSGILGAAEPNNASAFAIAFLLAAALLLVFYLFSRARLKSGRQAEAQQQQLNENTQEESGNNG